VDTREVQIERRAAQRFDMHVPVAVRVTASGGDACGFTQNLSARGTVFYTDSPPREGDDMELTLVMPAEITLGESMRVCCRGKVLRVLACGENKSLVAVFLEKYEYLPETEQSTGPFARISSLHERSFVRT
jgi:hypothetical protein